MAPPIQGTSRKEEESTGQQRSIAIWGKSQETSSPARIPAKGAKGPPSVQLK